MSGCKNRRWRATIDRQPDLVIATVTSSPAQTTFLDLAKAAVCGARIVTPRGRVVVLSDAEPPLGAGMDFVRTVDDPRTARKLVGRSIAPDWLDCFQWCAAARRASLFLASGLSDEVVEDIFATPLHEAAEVQRLIAAADQRCGHSGRTPDEGPGSIEALNSAKNNWKPARLRSRKPDA